MEDFVNFVRFTALTFSIFVPILMKTKIQFQDDQKYIFYITKVDFRKQKDILMF